MSVLVPRFPVYIPSKSRADIATTPAVLARLGVPYRIIVEENQFDDYAKNWGAERLLVLDPKFQDEYETCDDLGSTKSKGPGPARNFAWEHSISEGAEWHWVMDDNIRSFARYTANQRIPVGDAQMFISMEDFVTRYENVGMAGPEYLSFKPPRHTAREPFRTNHRVFSCNLIRNDVKCRWRARYNEDLILSIDMLKAGWCTVVFHTFLQDKMRTQVLPGGNTEEFYASEGTLPKSQMAVRVHPDVVSLKWRFGRWHHIGDFKQWDNMRLIRRADYSPPEASPRLVLRPRGSRPTPPK